MVKNLYMYQELYLLNGGSSKVVLLIYASMTTILFLPVNKYFLRKIGSVQNNFQGKLVPISLGGFIFFIETIILYFYQINDFNLIWYSLLAIAIVGTYDDLYGDSAVKGLKGHFSAFFKGKITSGFLKAIVGGLLSLALGLSIGKNIFESFTHFLLIMLMINLMNLFDLRPGRALKVFFIFFIGLSLSTPFLIESKLGYILLGVTLVVFFQDVHAKIMLGDSGANLIGLHIGIWSSQYMPIISQWMLILGLIGLHFYTEKKSLSELIENHRILKKIDLWGRKT